MRRTWKVVEWKNRPDAVTKIALFCPVCGNDAALPVAPEIVDHAIAASGLTMIFDPPGWKPQKNAMPDTIRCSKCRRIFSS